MITFPGKTVHIRDMAPLFRSAIRVFATILLAALLFPVDSMAGPDIRDVTWADLAPGGRDKREYARKASPLISLALGMSGETSEKPRLAAGLDGVRIRLSGYVVPLKFTAGGVEEFLLVPYVGACIHVPPPPRNQIVLVNSADPIEARGLFRAVTVTGILSLSSSKTELAESGYRLKAVQVSDYKEYRRIERLPGHPDRTSAP